MPPTVKEHRKPRFNAVALQRETNVLAEHLYGLPPGSRPDATWTRNWLLTVSDTYADGDVAASSLRLLITSMAVNQVPVVALTLVDHSTHNHTTKMNDHNEFHDNSTGPTGAKAIGPKATATSTGAVTQLASQPLADAADLTQLLSKLLVLIGEVNVPEPAAAKKKEATEAVKEVQSEVASQKPDRSKMRIALEKAKAWISSAVSFGAFAAEKAKEVEQIADQIGGYINN